MSGEVVGVDVGGTSIKACVVGPDGQIERFTHAPTPDGGADGHAVVAAVVEVVEHLTSGRHPRAVGVAVPGIVDEDAGVAVWSENLGWTDVPFGAHLTARWDVPVVVAHDVRAGGLAEHRVGACRGVRDAAFVPVGTGIAAALILDGRIHHGGGFSGEIGHIDIGHDLPCACGAVGCLEAIGSAGAVTRRYNAATGATLAGSKEVADLVRSGDRLAVRLWDEALDGLSRGLAVLAGVVSPEVIAVGGGFAQSADLVITPLTDRVGKRLTFQRMPTITSAELGDRAGCVGAGLRARDLASGA